jgi:chromatin segregation and condensation protein Rec8/ScpA/Scc1 (kleisin family)
MKKKDVIWTFVPLLHLSNQEKVLLEQAQHFGEIDIHIKELYGRAK